MFSNCSLLRFSLLFFISAFKENYPTIETLRMEVRNMEGPPGGSQGGPARAQIWSGSYGESAKVNQFKKNLGAPPLPDTGWALRSEVPV